MIHTEAIENNRGNIKLVRIIYDYDFDSGSWIEFNNLKDPSYPEQDLCWDNDDFIFGKFYKFLKRWDNKRLKKKDEEKFQEIWSILTDDLVSELLEMLDLAIKKEWYRSAIPSVLPTVSLSGGYITGNGLIGSLPTGTATTSYCTGYISQSHNDICSKCGKPSWNHLINYDHTSSTRS